VLERRHVQDVGAEGEVVVDGGAVVGRTVERQAVVGSVARRAEPGPGPGDDGHPPHRLSVRRADEGSRAGHLLEGDVRDDVGEVADAEAVDDRGVGLPPGGHDHGAGGEVAALGALLERHLQAARLAGHGGDLGPGVDGDPGVGDDGVDELGDRDGLEFPVGRPGREQLVETGRPATELVAALDEVDVVAGVGRFERGGEAGDAAADDEHRRLDVPLPAIGFAGPQQALDAHADVVLGQQLRLQFARWLAPRHEFADVDAPDHVHAER
jgi:hypothetical protein